MRFMMIVKAGKDSEAGKLPSIELVSAMQEYIEELIKAGVFVDAGGLHPSAKGARIKFANGKRTIIDGPFAETKELIGGFWVIQVDSMAQAMEWAKRIPNPQGEGAEGEIEIRQMYEQEDSPCEMVRRSVQKEEPVTK